MYVRRPVKETLYAHVYIYIYMHACICIVQLSHWAQLVSTRVYNNAVQWHASFTEVLQGAHVLL